MCALGIFKRQDAPQTGVCNKRAIQPLLKRVVTKKEFASAAANPSPEIPHQEWLRVRVAQATNGSLFPAAVLTLYATYLAYSALVSEPHDYPCNGLGQRLNAASATTLATGMALALISVVYSALRAGSNTALFRLGAPGDDDEEGNAAGQPLLDDEGGRAYVKVRGLLKIRVSC